MATQQKTLEELGAAIAELSKGLSSQLQNVNSPEPSLAVDSPASLPRTPEIQSTRVQLEEAILTLHQIVTGPAEFWLYRSISMSHDPLTMDVLNHFNFWDAVPLEGSASYAEIARATKLPEQIVRRFLRYAFGLFVFAAAGPNTDRVVHTAASAYMSRNPLARSMLGHNLQDMRPGATIGVEALEKWFVGTTEPTQEKNHCATSLALDDGTQGEFDMWRFLQNHERPGQPKGYRAKRFAEAMQFTTASMADGFKAVLDEFDWEGLGEASVVDLGGSAGHISVLLARKHPKLSLVVQDLPAAQAAFNANMEAEGIASRINFEVYDFFSKQERSADAYLIKSVLHDWPDKYVVQILQNQAPALKKGNHVLIFDFIVPPEYDEQGKPVMPLPARKFLAAVDIQMHVACNSKERSAEDWVSVVQQADSRLKLNKIHTVPASPLGILDFVFQG